MCLESRAGTDICRDRSRSSCAIGGRSWAAFASEQLNPERSRDLNVSRGKAAFTSRRWSVLSRPKQSESPARIEEKKVAGEPAERHPTASEPTQKRRTVSVAARPVQLNLVRWVRTRQLDVPDRPGNGNAARRIGRRNQNDMPAGFAG